VPRAIPRADNDISVADDLQWEALRDGVIGTTPAIGRRRKAAR
jgi:hypothetical protein